METKEFNLLWESWVRVRTQDGTIRTVSLTDALLHAHAYVNLAGEMPTQDAAMLRLLLAVVHTVFSRVDGNGVPAPFEETEDALLRWSELWQLGHFPEQPIRDYLDKWQDRFWLFHPERPFWQVPEAKIGSPFGAKKLNGEVFESENKSSLFSACAGTGKESMDYPQAARWLVSLNNYDAAAAKKKATQKPTQKPAQKPAQKPKSGPNRGDTVTVKKSATHFSSQSGGVKMAPYVPGGRYTVYQVKGNQVLIGVNGAYTGWVWKSDIQGYAKGTSHAKGGIANVDEMGLEFILGSPDKGRYKFLHDGDKVFNAKASEFLYRWANQPAKMLGSMIKSLSAASSVSIASPCNITVGDVIINGSADDKTVGELRRAHKQIVTDILDEFKRMKK